MPIPRFGLVLVVATLASTATVQSSERHHGVHSSERPIEVGQGAFAALAEIVAMLEADPNTDWSRVNVSALREHLVDMNVLTLDAAISEVSREDGLSIKVTGSGRTLLAIHQMVPAHAAELDKMPAWSASAETISEGAVLIVTSPDEAIQAKISALGFFGLMATGSHHQAHHLAIARGTAVHGHH
ncbi:MAG: hypothetical protein AAFO01_15960 [Pseudomonadota bacterium]